MRSIFVLVIIALGFAASLVSRQAALHRYGWFSLFRPLVVGTFIAVSNNDLT